MPPESRYTNYLRHRCNFLQSPAHPPLASHRIRTPNPQPHLEPLPPRLAQRPQYTRPRMTIFTPTTSPQNAQKLWTKKLEDVAERFHHARPDAPPDGLFPVPRPPHTDRQRSHRKRLWQGGLPASQKERGLLAPRQRRNHDPPPRLDQGRPHQSTLSKNNNLHHTDACSLMPIRSERAPFTPNAGQQFLERSEARRTGRTWNRRLQNSNSPFRVS